MEMLAGESSCLDRAVPRLPSALPVTSSPLRPRSSQGRDYGAIGAGLTSAFTWSSIVNC